MDQRRRKATRPGLIQAYDLRDRVGLNCPTIPVHSPSESTFLSPGGDHLTAPTFSNPPSFLPQVETSLLTPVRGWTQSEENKPSSPRPRQTYPHVSALCVLVFPLPPQVKPCSALGIPRASPLRPHQAASCLYPSLFPHLQGLPCPGQSRQPADARPTCFNVSQ